MVVFVVEAAAFGWEAGQVFVTVEASAVPARPFAVAVVPQFAVEVPSVLPLARLPQARGRMFARLLEQRVELERPVVATSRDRARLSIGPRLPASPIDQPTAVPCAGT